MESVLPVVIDGVIYASWLFMIAAGLTIIYGVMRILNMAHGSLYALGAYAAAERVRRAVRRAFAEIRPEGIYHLAAESHVDNSIRGPEQFVLTVVLTFNLQDS